MRKRKIITLRAALATKLLLYYRFVYICYMEMTAKGYLDQLIRVRDGLPSEVAKIIYANEVEIIDLNREDQLFNKGVLPNGMFSKSYKRTTQGFTRGYPKEKGKMFNFFDTGEMFDAFKMDTDGFELEIINNDPKVSLVSALAGGNVIGLTIENQKKLNYEIILPEILEYVNKYL